MVSYGSDAECRVQSEMSVVGTFVRKPHNASVSGGFKEIQTHDVSILISILNDDS